VAGLTATLLDGSDGNVRQCAGGALTATFLDGSKGHVRQCRPGALTGALTVTFLESLKRSAPLGFSVAQRSFRGCDRGSNSYVARAMKKVVILRVRHFRSMWKHVPCSGVLFREISMDC